MDELKAIRSFVAIITYGGFSSAAKTLGTSRGQITRHLSSLERQLGARLIHRTTRRVGLTTIGESYFAFCSTMLRDLDTEKEHVRAMHQAPEGLIRLVAPSSFGTLYLSQAVAAFAVAHPTIKIILNLNDTATSASNFNADDFDVALRLTPFSKNSPAIIRKIGMLNWEVCASPAYLKRLGHAINVPRDLAACNCLLPSLSPTELTWSFGSPGERETVRVTGTFWSNSLLALRIAAIEGLGVATLPAPYIKDDIENGRLTRIDLQPSVQARPVLLLLPDNRRIPKTTQILVSYLAKWYKSLLW